MLNTLLGYTIQRMKEKVSYTKLQNKRERYAKLQRYMNWGWKIFWSKKRDWKKWSFNKFKYSELTLLRNKATKCDYKLMNSQS